MFSSIDTSLFFLVNRSAANPFFDVLMPVLSNRGFLLVLPVLSLALFGLFKERTRPARRWIIYSLVLAVVPVAAFFLADSVNDLLKTAIARPRPCFVIEGDRLLARCPTSFSMPSGHAIASFAYAGSFFLLARNIIARGWRWYVLLLAAAIAFSRVYIGVHYPSDIAVGTVLGLAVATAVSAPLLRLHPSRQRRGGPQPDRADA
jgi:undecaprenyl-diphosphatase